MSVWNDFQTFQRLFPPSDNGRRNDPRNVGNTFRTEMASLI